MPARLSSRALTCATLRQKLFQPPRTLPAIRIATLADLRQSRSPGRLDGKIACVTGASSGIGRAIALAYHAEGAKVICADISPDTRYNSNDEETRGTTHDRINEADGHAIFSKVDVRKPAEVEALIKGAVKEFGRLDIMVNNAGLGVIEPPTAVWDTTEVQWDMTQAVNSKGVFLGMKYASRQMLKQDAFPSGDRGWIINISSILGLVGTYEAVPYCASKGAVLNMTKAAALDCAKYRIHVNAIGPGYTASSMTEGIFADRARQQELEREHPFRGLGTPEDLAKAAVFLASEDAQWITGVSFVFLSVEDMQCELTVCSRSIFLSTVATLLGEA